MNFQASTRLVTASSTSAGCEDMLATLPAQDGPRPRPPDAAAARRARDGPSPAREGREDTAGKRQSPSLGSRTRSRIRSAPTASAVGPRAAQPRQPLGQQQCSFESCPRGRCSESAEEPARREPTLPCVVAGAGFDGAPTASAVGPTVVQVRILPRRPLLGKSRRAGSGRTDSSVRGSGGGIRRCSNRASGWANSNAGSNPAPAAVARKKQKSRFGENRLFCVW